MTATYTGHTFLCPSIAVLSVTGFVPMSAFESLPFFPPSGSVHLSYHRVPVAGKARVCVHWKSREHVFCPQLSSGCHGA